MSLPTIDVRDREQREFVKAWLQALQVERFGEEEPAGIGDHVDDWRALDSAIAIV